MHAGRKEGRGREGEPDVQGGGPLMRISDQTRWKGVRNCSPRAKDVHFRLTLRVLSSLVVRACGVAPFIGGGGVYTASGSAY